MGLRPRWFVDRDRRRPVNGFDPFDRLTIRRFRTKPTLVDGVFAAPAGGEFYVSQGGVAGVGHLLSISGACGAASRGVGSDVAGAGAARAGAALADIARHAG